MTFLLRLLRAEETIREELYLIETERFCLRDDPLALLLSSPFTYIVSQETTKVKSKVFVSEKLCVKLLPILSSATFRISLGHRCILNLPYVLRIRVLLFRSPSHQPSTSHHCVPCR